MLPLLAAGGLSEAISICTLWIWQLENQALAKYRSFLASLFKTKTCAWSFCGTPQSRHKLFWIRDKIQRKAEDKDLESSGACLSLCLLGFQELVLSETRNLRGGLCRMLGEGQFAWSGLGEGPWAGWSLGEGENSDAGGWRRGFGEGGA